MEEFIKAFWDGSITPQSKHGVDVRSAIRKRSIGQKNCRQVKKTWDSSFSSAAVSLYDFLALIGIHVCIK